MAFFSTTWANALLNYSRGAGAPAATTGCTLSLHTADPGDGTALNEVTGGSYARQAIAFGAAASSSIAISGTPTFTNMPACTVAYIAIWSSGGTQIAHGALTASKVINAGDTYIQNTETISIA